jgi:transposase
MAARFINIDRDTPLLLPPDMRQWLPEGHLVHFILDVIEGLDLSRFKVNHRGTGSPQYPPSLLLALLVYSYATGTFSSRRIEQNTYESVPVRVLCADEHPDHDTICTFRRENQALFQEAFVQVLELAQALKFLQVGQITVAVDGSKVLANASKHSAVSYEHAGNSLEQLDLEIKELLKKAEAADSAPLQDGLTIPKEVQRRQERKAKLAAARAEIQARALARAAADMAEYKQKLQRQAQREAQGKKKGGKPPQPPSETPKSGDQFNFTDPESRIMKAGNGEHFEQAYNAQAAVEVNSRLIVGERVSQSPNDKKELVPTVGAIAPEVGSVGTVLADSGFFSEAAVGQLEKDPLGAATGTVVYAPLDKKSHHRRVEDLEKKPEPEAPAAGASVSEVMRQRLKTASGKALYKLRQQTVEPVFGIIKSVIGFRRFMLRGTEKVSLEWTVVCLGYNLRRLHWSGAWAKMAVLS